MKAVKALYIAIANPNQDRYIDPMSPQVMYQGVNDLNASLLNLARKARARESRGNPDQTRKDLARESRGNPNLARESRSGVSLSAANNFLF